jgi:hypothetical protein
MTTIPLPLTVELGGHQPPVCPPPITREHFPMHSGSAGRQRARQHETAWEAARVKPWAEPSGWSATVSESTGYDGVSLRIRVAVFASFGLDSSMAITLSTRPRTSATSSSSATAHHQECLPHRHPHPVSKRRGEKEAGVTRPRVPMHLVLHAPLEHGRGTKAQIAAVETKCRRCSLR